MRETDRHGFLEEAGLRILISLELQHLLQRVHLAERVNTAVRE